MQVTIFGASGNVGQLTVALALQSGYDVVAVVHTHNPFQGQLAHLKVIQLDIHDEVLVAQAMHGSAVIISTLGSWHTKQKDILATATKAIIKAMTENSTQRLITLTGSGALWAGDKPKLIDRLNHQFLNLVAPKILQDGETHLAQLASSELDWTCIRSPIMTNSYRTSYCLTVQLPSMLATIPRHAVAKALVDQIMANDFLRQAPTILRHS